MFHKAERKKAKLRLALCGVSGSGKTYSSLLIAKGIGGKIAVIDTENHSAELYSHLMDYDVAVITPPYSPDKYIQAIKAAEQAGYDILIIDSLTHAWAGEGGLLDKVDKVTKASSSKNSYTAWRDVTPMHNSLVNAILQSKMHVIATMRSKTEYQMTENDKGKKEIVKLGLAPIQREGMDYEFTTVLDISLDGHIAKASKDRTGIMDNNYEMPNEDLGKKFADWLNSGKEKAEIDTTQLFESIENAFDMETLKSAYAHAINFAKANELNISDKIIAAKDKRKSELEALTS